ncbi:MAG: AraC family transcriptional regulator [Verrucomicrobiota bacterium]
MPELACLASNTLNFTDSSHLARAFKKTYGMTISEFKAIGGNTCRVA